MDVLFSVLKWGLFFVLVLVAAFLLVSATIAVFNFLGIPLGV